MATSIMCKDVRTDGATLVKLEQPSPTTLKCGRVTYTIDPTVRAHFKLQNMLMANPHKTDGLYTMFYVSDHDHGPDAEVDETWHEILAPA